MTIRHTQLLCLIGLLSLAFLGGCAESEDPAEVDIRVHPDSWVDPTSEDFHGDAILTRAGDGDVVSDGLEGCVGCHGDLGASDGDQCFTCHATGSGVPGGHPDVYDWLSPDSESFHGLVVADDEGSDECQVCHGSAYEGGWSGVSCTLCHNYADDATNNRYELRGNGLYNPHPTNWFDTTANEFHGKVAAQRGWDYCRECHSVSRGEPDRWAGVRCYECHQSW